MPPSPQQKIHTHIIGLTTTTSQSAACACVCVCVMHSYVHMGTYLHPPLHYFVYIHGTASVWSAVPIYYVWCEICLSVHLANPWQRIVYIQAPSLMGNQGHALN